MRRILGEVLFWLHLPIVLIWLGLFFIPESLVPGKTVFHFWFILVVFASQVLWGLVMMPIRGRFGGGACPLTTLNQLVRGYAITDKRNYSHTFLEEFMARLHIKLSLQLMQLILFGSVGLIIIQYATR